MSAIKQGTLSQNSVPTQFQKPETNPEMISNLSVTNFKGVTANYTFGTGTLIQGRNFSGKSAIDQAIRLLVIGYVPDSAKTAAGIKQFASGYPMQISARIDANVEMRTPSIAFEKPKGTVKQTVDWTLAGELDEATRVLFDPSIFFDLSDAARITKACELVQSEGVTADDIALAIAGVLGIDTTPGKAVVKKEAMWPLYESWLNVVKAKAKTISDLISDSDAFFKEKRKIVNAEKARMQSTVEGVADLNAADAKALPPRHEVEAYRAQLDADLITLRSRIAAAEATIAHANRARQRRAEIAPIAAALAEKIQMEAFIALDVAAAESKVETTSATYNEKREARERLNRLASEANAAKTRRDQLTAEAYKSGHLTQAVADAEAAIDRIESEIANFSQKITEAKVVLEKAQAEANAPKALQAEAEIRTDDFSTGAVAGTHYLATCVISLGEGGAITIESIEDWRGLSKETEESEEQSRLKEYELAQAVIEAHEEVQALEDAYQGRQSVLKNTKGSLTTLQAALTRATMAAEHLATLPQAGAEPTAAELAQAEKDTSEAFQAVSAAKANLQNVRNEHMKARDALTSARAASDELERLNAAGQSETPDADAIAALKKDVEAKSSDALKAVATLAEITAAEQDQKRIQEAAAKREAVESEYKLLGKVLDVLTQKKTELVSGSIETPLAVANKLGAGILKGKLVFEEGEIGMRVGDSFVSARVFSGTETAIVMMGLTAGLAAKSKLRVLMLDEIGRLDVQNAQKLITNLCGMVDDGDIDQFIVIGPENPALAKCLDVEQTTGRLNLINVG